jgi:hypothetical protein
MDLSDELTELTYGRGFENPLRMLAEKLCGDWSGVVLSCLGPQVAPHLLTVELINRLEVMERKGAEGRPSHEIPIIRALGANAKKQRGVE